MFTSKEVKKDKLDADRKYIQSYLDEREAEANDSALASLRRKAEAKKHVFEAWSLEQKAGLKLATNRALASVRRRFRELRYHIKNEWSRLSREVDRTMDRWFKSGS